MAAAKRYRVKATMIVAKVPGAQGGEVYLRAGRLVPDTVTAAETKRLAGLGLIEVVKDAPAPAATSTEPTEAEKKAAADKAAADKAEADKVAAAAAAGSK
jgi:hypothetical protein